MARPAAELTAKRDAAAEDLAAGLNADADVKAAVATWLTWLRDERRMAALTVEAYYRDLTDFLSFSSEHLGKLPALADLAAFARGDFRAWMAARAGRNLQAASTARALSAIKSFYRLAIRRGLIAETGITALRTPKLPRSLPKPLNAGEALEAVAAVGDLARQDWIGKRDIAVLTLLYGCGLRISEALGLRRGDIPAGTNSEAMPLLRITGKGGKTRMVPILPVVIEAIRDYLAICPFGAAADDPLFFGARGGPLQPRLIQGAMQRLCPYGNPGMAVGGMGDVLTGVIAAFIAQGLALEDAANAGVLAHALAGDRAAQAGQRGTLPSDLIAELRAVVNP